MLISVRTSCGGTHQFHRKADMIRGIEAYKAMKP